MPDERSEEQPPEANTAPQRPSKRVTLSAPPPQSTPVINILDDVDAPAAVEEGLVDLEPSGHAGSPNLLSPDRSEHLQLEARLDAVVKAEHAARWRKIKGELAAFSILITYLVIGVLFYTINEEWTFGFAIYFCVVVATTVGYGDHDPITTNGARVFTCVWVFFGVALVLGVSSFLVVQLMDDRRRRKLAQQRKKKRRNARQSRFKGLKKGFVNVGRKGLHAVSRLSSKAIRPAAPLFNRLSRALDICSDLKWPFINMLITWVVWIVFFIFYGDEDLTFVEALYFTVISGTTVGFGDLSPLTVDGRAFATVWLVVLVVATTGFLGHLAEKVVPTAEDTQLSNLLREGPKAIYCLSESSQLKGEMDYSDWLETLVLATGKVDKAFITTAREHFTCFDLTANGKITAREVQDLDSRFKSWKESARSPSVSRFGALFSRSMDDDSDDDDVIELTAHGAQAPAVGATETVAAAATDDQSPHTGSWI
eukprot:m.68127 g.68127  ORF g.68127 m.68127 type:complete len:482 (-) comp9903_c0_seq2:129-1574(-)